MREMIVCEAGFFWRLVMRRFEKRVNWFLERGWKTDEDDSVFIDRGVFRLCLIARLEAPVEEKTS